MERSERELVRSIKKRVEAVENVRNCHQVSVRMIGKKFDVDMHISLNGSLRFEEVHRIASEVERQVRNVVPNARVTVHTEPVGNHQRSIRSLVKEVVEGVPGSRGIHNVHVQKIDGKLCIDLHLEVAANMTVRQAHEVSDQVEKKLRAANPEISEITVHMESASDLISRELTAVDAEIRWYVEHVARSFPGIKDVRNVAIRRIGNALHMELSCYFDSDIKMEEAHKISDKLEAAIKGVYPNVDRIDIHEEPFEDKPTNSKS